LLTKNHVKGYAMPGLADILSLGKRALFAHSSAMNVAGNNIANVNTRGFTRRQADLTESANIATTAGFLGTGVEVRSIVRQTNVFISQQLREYGSQHERFASMNAQFTRIETIFNEPSENGLSAALDQFWDAWQELADNPENQVARTNLQQRTHRLTDTFHRLDNDLRELRASIDQEFASAADHINQMAKEIAELNRRIVAVGSKEAMPNDLLDRRDLLIEELAMLAKVTVDTSEDGAMTVFVESYMLVQRESYNTLSKATSAPEGDLPVTNILVAGDKPLNFTSGKLKGLLELRDRYLPQYMSALDEMAGQLVASVNAAHTTGYDLSGDQAGNFFDPEKTTASSIALTDEIAQNTSKIAASADGTVGDNRTAQSIAGLRNALLLENASTTLNGFYNNLVGSLGLAASDANSSRENYEIIVEQLTFQRDAVQGVSLDEEMANLLRSQEAFNAAAKLITKADEMIQAVLNMV
jgi:flagellar hook-associated protein 1 FlgK